MQAENQKQGCQICCNPSSEQIFKAEIGIAVNLVEDSNIAKFNIYLGVLITDITN